MSKSHKKQKSKKGSPKGNESQPSETVKEMDRMLLQHGQNQVMPEAPKFGSIPPGGVPAENAPQQTQNSNIGQQQDEEAIKAQILQELEAEAEESSIFPLGSQMSYDGFSHHYSDEEERPVVRRENYFEGFSEVIQPLASQSTFTSKIKKMRQFNLSEGLEWLATEAKTLPDPQFWTTMHQQFHAYSDLTKLDDHSPLFEMLRAYRDGKISVYNATHPGLSFVGDQDALINHVTQDDPFEAWSDQGHDEAAAIRVEVDQAIFLSHSLSHYCAKLLNIEIQCRHLIGVYYKPEGAPRALFCWTKLQNPYSTSGTKKCYRPVPHRQFLKKSGIIRLFQQIASASILDDHRKVLLQDFMTNPNYHVKVVPSNLLQRVVQDIKQSRSVQPGEMV